MESKITVHVGEDFKPCIRFAIKKSEDVRDILSNRLIELLNSSSRTFKMHYECPDHETPDGKQSKIVHICPVSDEIQYFKSSILKRLVCQESINELDSMSENRRKEYFNDDPNKQEIYREGSEAYEKIHDFFDWVEKAEKDRYSVER